MASSAPGDHLERLITICCGAGLRCSTSSRHTGQFRGEPASSRHSVQLVHLDNLLYGDSPPHSIQPSHEDGQWQEVLPMYHD